MANGFATMRLSHCLGVWGWGGGTGVHSAQGQPGDQGPTGETGLAGSQGPPGRRGDPGPPGKSQCGIRTISGETMCCGEDLSPKFFDGARSAATTARPTLLRPYARELSPLPSL